MIRKIIVTAFIMPFWVFCYTQYKNSLLIGGNIGAMYSSNDISDLDINSNYNIVTGFTPTNLIGTYGDNSGDYKTNYINLNQSTLVYLTEKLLIGVEFSLLSEQNKYESDLITKSKIISYLISPSLRYYIYQGLFGQLQYNFGITHENIICNNIDIPTQTGFLNLDYTTNIEANTRGFGISAGYSINLGNNLNTEIAIMYIKNKSKFEYDNRSEDGTYNIKQNTALISVGFKYILKRKTSK